MDIPIKKYDHKGIKRYRYSALFISAADGLASENARRWFLDPNPFCERSLDEWSDFFGFEVKLISPDIEPASIDWDTPATREQQVSS